jgi:hypothetical protein
MQNKAPSSHLLHLLLLLLGHTRLLLERVIRIDSFGRNDDLVYRAQDLRHRVVPLQHRPEIHGCCFGRVSTTFTTTIVHEGGRGQYHEFKTCLPRM